MNAFSTRFETSLQQRVDPRVVLASKILQLGQQELEQAIETELSENPALERLDEDSLPLDAETILRSVAPQELRARSEDSEFLRSVPQDDAADWLDFAPSHTTLWEHLRGQLYASVPQRLHVLADYLVDCVDERGYFGSSVEDAALATSMSLEDTQRVFDELRKCQPLGVGATSLEDCLLIQLRQAKTVEQKLARAIVKSHMDEFIAKRTKRLCRQYRVVPEVIEAAFQIISELEPYPAQEFQVSSCPKSSKAPAVLPDLILSRTDAGWTVEVRGADPTSFAINRTYENRLRELDKMSQVPRDERRHITSYVERANGFISCLNQRRRTLRKIGEYLIEHQGGFISTASYQFLQSLTRAKMAAEIGIHESTVSRATMDKFVQLATGEVVPFEIFFKPALRVQKIIEEILNVENPQNPLSDERIAQMLAEKGVQVARRTVNKYRDRRRLLSSRKRRSA